MEKIIIFRKRLLKLNINLQFIGNYPWIYLDTINNKKVTELFEADHGFTVAFLPARSDKELHFTNITKIFQLIRKYINN